MSIAENIQRIKLALPAHVQLVAVSKTKPNEFILEAYRAGQHIFGENKVQELVQKYHDLPKDIEWHLIGHLQTNKVKFIAPFVQMIHSVDSLKLLSFINDEALKNNRTISCLLQFHIAEEESKYGMNLKEANELLRSNEYGKMNNVKIVGVMGMATFTDDTDQIRREFSTLKNIFSQLKREFFAGEHLFREISMGMSDDYPIAIEEGSTMVRLGSTIFGERKYSIGE